MGMCLVLSCLISFPPSYEEVDGTRWCNIPSSNGNCSVLEKVEDEILNSVYSISETMLSDASRTTDEPPPVQLWEVRCLGYIAG